jgi:hypothetical protein
MRSRLLRLWDERRAAVAAAVAVLAILVGVLAWFVPYLTDARSVSGGVPAPPPLAAVTDFELDPGQSACMSTVAVEPASRVAEFSLRPAGPKGAPSPSADPPERMHSVRGSVELVLTAPGYHAHALTPSGDGHELARLPIEPPKHSLLATACFVDRGTVAVLLDGTAEARTITRSTMVVAGASVVGDVSLSFYEAPRRSLLSSLGTVFARASRLTEDLVPSWLIWIVAVLVALGLPLGIVAALYVALREEGQATGGSGAGGEPA